MKVLMAIDDEKSAKQLLTAVLQQFQPATSEIRVLHVVQPVTSASMPQMSPEWTPELEVEKHDARFLVHTTAQQLTRAGFKIEKSVEIGDPERCILENAQSWHADIILVGSHSRARIQDLLLGDTAESVARHARCSVEIVRIAA